MRSIEIVNGSRCYLVFDKGIRVELSEQSNQNDQYKRISKKNYLFISTLVVIWCFTFPVNGSLFQITSYLIPLLVIALNKTRIQAFQLLKNEGKVLFLCLVLPILISGIKEYLQTHHFDVHDIFVFTWRLLFFPIALASIARTGCFNEKRFGRIFTVLLVIYALVGIVQYSTGHIFYKGSGYTDRMYSLVGNPNPFGLLMAFGVVLALVQRSLWGSWVTIFLTFSSVMLLIVCVFLSGSRGAWLALAVGLTIVSFIRYRDIPFRSYILISFILLGAILIISQLDSVASYLQMRLSHIDSDAPRMHLWPHYFHLAMKLPFFGHGTMPMRFNYGGELIHGPHDIYLEVLFRTGIFGFFLFLSLILFILKRFWQSVGGRPYVALLFVLLIGGCFDYSVYGAEFFQSLFALLIARAISSSPEVNIASEVFNPNNK